MTKSIIYKRAFIKAACFYIPLVQHTRISEVKVNSFLMEQPLAPLKHWHVCNYSKEDSIIFTKDEMEGLAEIYSHFDWYDSHKVKMSPEDIKKKFLGGMRSAKTVEEYSRKNHIYIIEHRIGRDSINHPVTTTKNLLIKVKELEGKKLDLSFRETVLKSVTESSDDNIEDIDNSSYALLHNSGGYFFKFNKEFEYILCKSAALKTFSTEKKALKYLEKYENILKDFVVQKVEATDS